MKSLELARRIAASVKSGVSHPKYFWTQLLTRRMRRLSELWDLNLARTGIISLVIGVAGFSLQLLIGIVMSRALGAHGYGVYSFSLLVASMLIIPVDSGIATYLLRHSSLHIDRKNYASFSQLFLRCLLLTLLISLIAMVLVWTTGQGGGGYAEKLSTLFHVFPIILILALARITLSAVYSVQKVNKGQIVTMIVQPLVILVGVAWLFITGADQHPRAQPESVLWVQLFAGIVAILGNIWLLSEFLTGVSAGAFWRNCHVTDIKAIFLLTLTGGIGWLNAQTDMLFMGLYMPLADLGVYRIAVTAASVMIFPLVAFNTVIAPKISTLYSDKKFDQIEEILRTSVVVTTTIVAIGGVSLVLFGKFIINLLFGPEFGFAYYPMLILIFGQLVNCASGAVGVVLNMTGHEAQALRGTVLSGLFNIILCALLIPQWGVIGAAIASASSTVFWNSVMLYLAKQKVGLRISLFSHWLK